MEQRGESFEERHIITENPTNAEIRVWQNRSGLPLKKFFNTSGLKYRELNLKDKLPEMSEEEQLELLVSDGMLAKRPLLIGEDYVLVGYNEAKWSAALGK